VKFLAYPIMTIFSVACKRKSAQVAARAHLLPSIDRDQVPNYRATLSMSAHRDSRPLHLFSFSASLLVFPWIDEARNIDYLYSD
jgi:hypothetical protein